MDFFLNLHVGFPTSCLMSVLQVEENLEATRNGNAYIRKLKYSQKSPVDICLHSLGKHYHLASLTFTKTGKLNILVFHVIDHTKIKVT